MIIMAFALLHTHALLQAYALLAFAPTSGEVCLDQCARPATDEGIYAGYRTARVASRGGDPWTYGNYRSNDLGVALLSESFVLDSPDRMHVVSREMASLAGDHHSGLTQPQSPSSRSP